MLGTSLLFVLTPYGLTSLALLLLTAAFVIFLVQSRPRTAAGRWMLGHEVSLALFLTAHLLLNSTFLSIWYPVMYGSVVVGMACLLQFAFAFPQPGPDPRLARRMLTLSIGSIALTLGLTISFWLAPQTGQALVLRNAAMALGLWQCLAALAVLAYRTVQLDATEAERGARPRRIRALLRPQQPAARAARAMLLAALSIAALLIALVVYRVWLQPIISQTLFNIAWSIGLMLLLSLFAIRYLIYTPETISFQAKLTLGTLTAVLTSIWLLSLIQPFQLQAAYDAARQADVLTVQAEVSRRGGVADAFPSEVMSVAVCPPTADASDPRVLLGREGQPDLSGLCGPRFLIGNTLGIDRPATVNVLYQFRLDGQTYLVSFAYAAYLAALNPVTLPIALVMVGSTLIILLLLPRTFYQNLIRPLGVLLTGVQQVNQGQLDVVVPIQSNDEIGLLTRAFNAMATELRTSLVKLEDQVTAYRQAEQALREQREQLRALTRRLAEVEEIERGKLGRELHDQAGQNLTALSLTLKLVRTQLASSAPAPETLDQLLLRLDDASDLVKQTTQRIRHVMDDLQPPALDEFGLAAALRWHAARFTSRTNVLVLVHSPEPAPRLPRPVEVALFRIAQEALTNVARHAHATQVDIQVVPDAAGVRLSITDNGIGFAVQPSSQAAGRSTWGLRIMAERAEAVGGVFRIETRPEQGTQISVEVKL